MKQKLSELKEANGKLNKVPKSWITEKDHLADKEKANEVKVDKKNEEKEGK